MPSQYAAWCRSDPYDAWMGNLAKARRSPRYHPRPWRRADESEMIRRLAFQWMSCRDRNSRPFVARQLGISHTHVGTKEGIG